MINLLPPAIKVEISYSRRNAILAHYLRTLVLAVIVLATLFGGTEVYLSARVNAAEAEAEKRQAEAEAARGIENRAKALSERLSSAKAILASQSKFSALLDDMSKIMPAGTVLSGISLSGDEKRPLAISATAETYASALALRDTMSNSSRFQNVDIQSVAAVGPRLFRVELVAGFKPGQAK